MYKTLKCCNKKAFKLQKNIVRDLDEKDVDMYLFFTDTTTVKNGYTSLGKAAGIGTACDNVSHRKYSLTYGPKNGLMNSVEVSLHIYCYNYNIRIVRILFIIKWFSRFIRLAMS